MCLWHTPQDRISVYLTDKGSISSLLVIIYIYYHPKKLDNSLLNPYISSVKKNSIRGKFIIQSLKRLERPLGSVLIILKFPSFPISNPRDTILNPDRNSRYLFPTLSCFYEESKRKRFIYGCKRNLPLQELSIDHHLKKSKYNFYNIFLEIT